MYMHLQLKDGVTFEDLRTFTQLIESISDVEMALGMYMAAGASITAGMNEIVYNVMQFENFDALFLISIFQLI